MSANRPQFLAQGNRLSRRRFAGSVAVAGIAAAAAGLVGCSSSKNNNTGAAKPAASVSSGQASTAATAAVGAATRAATAAAAGSPAAATLDSTKGKPGGTLKYILTGYPAKFTVIDSTNPHLVGGLIYSSLLAQKWGVQGVRFDDYTLETDAAQAMPEQPDQSTYTFKLRPGMKFHNGRAVTSQDVQYSFDRYAQDPKSVYGVLWKTWYDHIETPDPQTVVLKTKMPFADTLESVDGNTDGFIMAKEFEESPDANNKMLGSGPYIFQDTQAPILITLKKNPDYYLKPYPYFDQVQMFCSTDHATQLADFVSKQVQMPWIVYADDRDQIKQQRPDAKLEAVTPYSSSAFAMRTDEPPFNDKRVRQALSMALDRKAIRDTINKGEGELDQFFSIMYQKQFGTSKPADLGAPFKYWNFDVQGAKQLMAAAGVTQPIDSVMHHYDASIIGQWFPDLATIAQAQWKQAGIANIKDDTQLASAYQQGAGIGKYEGMTVHIQTGFTSGLRRGLQVLMLLYTDPSGQQAPQNWSHVNDPDLNPLVQKQLQQLNVQDRQQTFKQMEQIMAEQQYWIALSSTSQNWFFDPSLVNAQMAQDQGSRRYAMKWWFS